MILVKASWMSGLGAALACSAACAATPPPSPPSSSAPLTGLPRRCRVHVDHVARTRMSDFESARKELLAAFASKGASEGTTYVLETDEPTYLSLRPFEQWAELDGAGARQKQLDDAVGAETLARLDAVTHATLVPPHRNEMWSLQTSLTYAPAGGPTLGTATLGRLVEHEVMPERDDAYGEAVTREVHALTEAHYPVTRAVYVSAYGSGRYVTLWLAASRGDLETRLPPAAWNEEAKARSASSDEVQHTLLVRTDLGSR
jgi:hypothetical protein